MISNWALVFGLNDFPQESGMSKDESERGAQFMGSNGDEVTLHAVELGHLLL